MNNTLFLATICFGQLMLATDFTGFFFLHRVLGSFTNTAEGRVAIDRHGSEGCENVRFSSALQWSQCISSQAGLWQDTWTAMFRLELQQSWRRIFFNPSCSHRNNIQRQCILCALDTELSHHAFYPHSSPTPWRDSPFTKLWRITLCHKENRWRFMRRCFWEDFLGALEDLSERQLIWQTSGMFCEEYTKWISLFSVHVQEVTHHSLMLVPFDEIKEEKHFFVHRMQNDVKLPVEKRRK